MLIVVAGVTVVATGMKMKGVNLHMTYERVENAEKAMAAWRHFAKNTNIGPTLAPVCFEAGLYSYA